MYRLRGYFIYTCVCYNYIATEVAYKPSDQHIIYGFGYTIRNTIFLYRLYLSKWVGTVCFELSKRFMNWLWALTARHSSYEQHFQWNFSAIHINHTCCRFMTHFQEDGCINVTRDATCPHLYMTKNFILFSCTLQHTHMEQQDFPASVLQMVYLPREISSVLIESDLFPPKYFHSPSVLQLIFLVPIQWESLTEDLHRENRTERRL